MADHQSTVSDQPAPRVREIHGVRATKLSMSPEQHALDVTVSDGTNCIILNFSVAYPAGLSADDARCLANELNAAAARLEARLQSSPG